MWSRPDCNKAFFQNLVKKVAPKLQPEDEENDQNSNGQNLTDTFGNRESPKQSKEASFCEDSEVKIYEGRKMPDGYYQ